MIEKVYGLLRGRPETENWCPETGKELIAHGS